MGSSLQNAFGFDSDLWIYLVENIVIIIIYHIVTEVILTKKLNHGVGKIQGIRRGGKIMLRKLMKYDLKILSQDHAATMGCFDHLWNCSRNQLLCSIMKYFMIISQ